MAPINIKYAFYLALLMYFVDSSYATLDFFPKFDKLNPFSKPASTDSPRINVPPPRRPSKDFKDRTTGRRFSTKEFQELWDEIKKLEDRLITLYTEDTGCDPRGDDKKTSIDKPIIPDGIVMLPVSTKDPSMLIDPRMAIAGATTSRPLFGRFPGLSGSDGNSGRKIEQDIFAEDFSDDE